MCPRPRSRLLGESVVPVTLFLGLKNEIPVGRGGGLGRWRQEGFGAMTCFCVVL